MKKRMMFLAAMMLMVCGMTAQQQRQVESLRLDATDLSASTQRRMDNGGKACALVKVQTTAKISKVEGGVVGDIIDKGSEKWVYVQAGTDQLTIYPEGEKPVVVSFSAGGTGSAKSLLTYQLVLTTNMGEGGAKYHEAEEYFRAGNEAKAFECMQAAVEAGYLPAYVTLGNFYFNGIGVAKDLNKAYEYYKKGAELGDASAQFQLGDMYYNGDVVKQDFQQSAYWCEKAAEQGLAPAQHAIGDMYLNGRGVAKDSQKALEWIRKAADQGLADAQLGMGILYFYGNVVGKDVDKAISWLQKAADQDNASAMSIMGTIYMVEKGDAAKAMEMIKRAAALGDPGAMGNIGTAMIYGYNVPVDYNKGFEYLQKAEQAGNRGIYSALAECYENGWGTAKDKKKAKKYKEMAVEAAKQMQQGMRNMR